MSNPERVRKLFDQSDLMVDEKATLVAYKQVSRLSQVR
jgi:hypothetical protein